MKKLIGYEILTIALGAIGCGSDAAGQTATITPYGQGEAVLIGEVSGGEETQLDRCEEDVCDSVAEQCGSGAAADIIIDAQGNVVDVICYEQDVVVESVELDQVEEAEAGNKTVLVLDGEDDGLDVEGDVTISGNNAVVWGEGPDVSVIGGTLDIQKNNAIVRGVRIQEDVVITKNDTQMAFCVIEGDLTITGNNTTLAECTVFGEVKIVGQNTVLVGNLFQTELLQGFNLTCNGNHGFQDDDADGVVDDIEVGGVIECVEAAGQPMPQSSPLPAPDAGIEATADAG
jgi:hypothetical protein